MKTNIDYSLQTFEGFRFSEYNDGLREAEKYVTSSNKKLFEFNNVIHSGLDNAEQPSRTIAYKFINDIPLTSQESEDYLQEED